MIQYEEYKVKLNNIKPTLDELHVALRTDDARNEIEELEQKSAADGFWNDIENSQKVLQRLKQLKAKCENYDRLVSKWDDLYTLCEMGLEEDDDSLLDEIVNGYAELEEGVNTARLTTLLTGEYDSCNAILTFHAGAGGTEAQDWCQMLYRMYTRWAERHSYAVKTLDYEDGEEAGIKSATIMISGPHAYGYLKSENGVHRLVRISPFDASGRRQTSFASVEVMPEFEDDDSIVIRDEDIEVTAHRSSGAGGQHINKTDSAIRIVHKPTGIVVGCQTERSQLQNKETAMHMLKSKLMEIKLQEKLDRIEDIQGVKANIEWGAQIRSYVFMPYTLVKDTRTGYENGNVNAVMDGDLDGFINAYLKMITAQNNK